MRTIVTFAFVSAFLALPLTAETPYSITPDIGPTSGGTTVTVKGDFGFSNYGVIFGAVPATSTTKVDEHTLIAVTPPHMPGRSSVTIFEYDIGISTDLTFRLYGSTPPNYERVMLPIFTPPVHGAFGSEFHTDLRVANPGTGRVSLYGLKQSCGFPCPGVSDDTRPYEVDEGEEIGPEHVEPTGDPAQFLWVTKTEGAELAMNLRVHDVTRDDQNFGTEIPIVRDSDWRINRLTFVGVPTDPRFRNTLRLYGGNYPYTALVRVGDRPVVRVPMSLTTHLFDVVYGVFSDFPSDAGFVSITVDFEVDFDSIVAPEVEMWGMITVTNNDTQAITTITPQP
jgi:IPT/TIG domain.